MPKKGKCKDCACFKEYPPEFKKHTEEFWTNFKFLIKEADIINIYKPVDYKKSPVMYCGMNITDNPLYDF